MLETQLGSMVAAAAAAAAAAKDGKATSGYAFLSSCVLGNHALAMPADHYDFLCHQVAVYLDPFLDGEVPRDQYHARCAESFIGHTPTLTLPLTLTPTLTRAPANHFIPSFDSMNSP